MNVVTRSLMATGLAVYAGIHLLQAARSPDGAPLWLTLAFVATAVAGLVLAGLVLFRGSGDVARWMDAGAGMAGASLVALLASLTIGFPGVTDNDIRMTTIGAVVAEVVVLLSWAAQRFTGPQFDEVDEPVPDLPFSR